MTAAVDRLAGWVMAALVPMDVCPVAPGNAQRYVDQITGYVLWGVKALFLVAIIVSVGAIVAGRLFSMPHASKVGVVSLAVVFIAALAYLVLPGLLDTVLGSGCIPTGNPGPSPTGSESVR